MKIIGINRVELLVADPEREAAALNALLGIRLESSVTEAHGVLSCIDFNAGLELAGPTSSESALAPLLDQRGEGLLTVVFRVESVDAVIEMAERNGLEVLVDLEDIDQGDSDPRYKSYRQVSLSSERFPARTSFTFAEYEEV